MLIDQPAFAAPGRRLSARTGSADVAHWGGVFAMTLCVFALIASEFMPVSLLTPIASALGVSEGRAGPGRASPSPAPSPCLPAWPSRVSRSGSAARRCCWR